jgi:hypothetical protein
MESVKVARMTFYDIYQLYATINGVPKPGSLTKIVHLGSTVVGLLVQISPAYILLSLPEP